MTTTLPVIDPVRAKAYFDDKLAFTTGPVELERMIKSGSPINIIDVREAEDYAKGHIHGAVNLPKEKWSTLEGLSRDMTNVVYCYNQQCHLAATACSEFAGKGFPVMELDGGFDVWKKNDLNIDREPINRLLKETRSKLFQKRH